MNQFDAMFKTINQVAQVGTIQKDALREIFEGYAKGRTPMGNTAPLMNWIKESVPNVDQSTFTKIMNTISAGFSRIMRMFRPKCTAKQLVLERLLYRKIRFDI